MVLTESIFLFSPYLEFDNEKSNFEFDEGMAPKTRYKFGKLHMYIFLLLLGLILADLTIALLAFTRKMCKRAKAKS